MLLDPDITVRFVVGNISNLSFVLKAALVQFLCEGEQDN